MSSWSYKRIVQEKYPGAESQNLLDEWIIWSPTIQLGKGRSSQQAWANAAIRIRAAEVGKSI